MSRKIAFLSMDDMAGFISDDDLVFDAFRMRDIDVETVSWRADCDWNQFDAAIIRSTWDYQSFFKDFLLALRSIEQSRALLMNSLDVVQWNIDKRYLADVQKNGVSVIPTTWMDQFDLELIEDSVHAFGSDELIIKPTVSANADNTIRFLADDLETAQLTDELGKVFACRSAMIQPFVGSVLTEGEYSLFVIGGELTHGVVKKPKRGDFRVQEEHGGSINAFQPDSAWQKFASNTMEKLPSDLLYARIDVVMYQNLPCVMEIELIEPSLYFRFSDLAIQKFVASVTERIEQGS